MKTPTIQSIILQMQLVINSEATSIERRKAFAKDFAVYSEVICNHMEISRTALAPLLGVSHQLLSMYVTGTKAPSHRVVKKLLEQVAKHHANRNKKKIKAG